MMDAAGNVIIDQESLQVGAEVHGGSMAPLEDPDCELKVCVSVGLCTDGGWLTTVWCREIT